MGSCLQECCPLAVSQIPGSRLLTTPNPKAAGIYLGESFRLIKLTLRLFSLLFSYILRGGSFLFLIVSLKGCMVCLVSLLTPVSSIRASLVA